MFFLLTIEAKCLQAVIAEDVFTKEVWVKCRATVAPPLLLQRRKTEGGVYTYTVVACFIFTLSSRHIYYASTTDAYIRVVNQSCSTRLGYVY